MSLPIHYFPQYEITKHQIYFTRTNETQQEYPLSFMYTGGTTYLKTRQWYGCFDVLSASPQETHNIEKFSMCDYLLKSPAEAAEVDGTPKDNEDRPASAQINGMELSMPKKGWRYRGFKYLSR